MTGPQGVRLILTLLFATLSLWQPAALSAQAKRPKGPDQAAQPKTPARVAGPNWQRPPSSPVLTLTADPDSPFEGQNVHFTATWSQMVPRASYRFEWGDGEYIDSDLPQANHSYSARGPHTVRVTAKALVNDRVIAVRSNDLTISVSQAPAPEELPVPTLSANPPRSRVDELVTFTAVLDPRVGPPQYHFVFDDGTDEFSYANRIVHTYRHPREYHPYVQASLGHGDATVTSAAIQVAIDAAPSEVEPRLTVTLLTKEPTAGKNVTVEASLDPPHKDVRYEFNWDDGTPPKDGGANGLASHKYAVAKLYTVRVAAWTKGTDTGPATGTVQIVVQRAVWPPDPAEAGLLVLLVGAGAAVGWYLTRRARKISRPDTDLRVTGHPDAGNHQISQMERVDSHLSLTLRPGMDPGTDRITFL